jgi:hypothetical protein
MICHGKPLAFFKLEAGARISESPANLKFTGFDGGGQSDRTLCTCNKGWRTLCTCNKRWGGPFKPSFGLSGVVGSKPPASLLQRTVTILHPNKRQFTE